MTERVNEGKLRISTSLHALLEQEIAPDLNLDTAKFWQDFQKNSEKYISINEELLEKREDLQKKRKWEYGFCQNKNFTGNCDNRGRVELCMLKCFPSLSPLFSI